MDIKKEFSEARINTQFDSGIKFEIECEKIADNLAIKLLKFYYKEQTLGYGNMRTDYAEQLLNKVKKLPA